MIDREKLLKLFWDYEKHHSYLFKMGLYETAEIMETTLNYRKDTLMSLMNAVFLTEKKCVHRA